MTVVDDNGLPAPDVKVSMKESWESWDSWEVTDDADKAYFRQRWESDFVPWYEGVTNAEGKAVIPIVITALDHTRGSEPPANRDFVSNREHIVKLQGQNGQDEMLVVMKPDEEASGKRYTIRIEKIEKPIYVPTP